MDWLEAVKPIAESPAGQIVVAVLVMIFGSSSILSEKTAKEKFGAVGMILRWRQRRKDKAEAFQEELFRKRTEELRAEIRRVDNARKIDRKELTAQISELQKNEKSQHEYILWVTEKMRKIEIWAADHGYDLPPPPFITFVEWEAQRETETPGEEDDDEEPAPRDRANLDARR